MPPSVIEREAEVLVRLDGARLERSLVGGKGASLSRLVGLGAMVPPAFALTVEAYATLARVLDLPGRADRVADGELPAIRAAIEGAALPATVREALQVGLTGLRAAAGDAVELAVRSSATAEDSATASFAGLHDTVLGVRDFADLEAAVKRCWASLWTERAVAYRRSNGLAAAEGAIAVVVQQLVRSDVSLVVFTTDPVSGRDDHLVIDATWGLGEALVSGLVSPDHVVVDPVGRIVEYVVGEKDLMVIPGASSGDGVRQVAVPRALRGVPVLAPEQVASIAATARGLARRLGFAADLEAGLAGGRLYLYQARPITTLDSGERRGTRATATDASDNS
jgi:pyruvate,water dikinase